MKTPLVISGYGMVSTAGVGWASFCNAVFADAQDANIQSLPFNGQEYLFAQLPSEFNSANGHTMQSLAGTCMLELTHTSGRSVAELTARSTALLLGVTAGVQQRWKGDGQPQLYGDAIALDEFIESHALDEIVKQFGFSGPAMTVNTACASSLSALSMACKMVESGMADRAVVGAIELLNWFDVAGFSCAGLLSKTSCKPFDKNRDGIMLGEAAVFVLVEKMQEAKHPRYTICSFDSRNDLYDIAKPEPGGANLKQCIHSSLQKAGLEYDDIDYVNAHGTGTVQNDVAESLVYSSIWPATRCDTFISSTKGMHGHLRAAGGLLELLACGAAMSNSKVPFNKGCSEPDISCEWNCALAKNHSKQIDHALSVSRGFGGSNVSMIIGKA